MIKYAYLTDLGKRRQLNEDAVLCLTSGIRFQDMAKDEGIFVLADGMGGHNAGEVASEWGTKVAALEILKSNLIDVEIAANAETTAKKLVTSDILIEGVKRANNFILDLSRKSASTKDMGTTMVLALLNKEKLVVANVGDSRCYLITEEGMEQLTRDHSYVQELVEMGVLTSREARHHPRRNEITRCVGYFDNITVDIFERTLYKGDRVLLCSDGLHGVMEDEDIRRTVRETADLNEACKRLIEEANNGGGPDNISVILFEVEGLQDKKEVLDAATLSRKEN